MCEPTTITLALLATTTALSMAGTAVSYVSQNENAKAQADFQKRRMEDTAIAANKAQQESAMQARAQTAQQMSQTSAQAANAKADVKLAAADGGASGLSVDALLADYNRQEAVNNFAAGYNLDITQNQLLAQRNDRVAAAQAQPVARPSLAAAGLQMAGQGLGGALQGLQYQPPGNGGNSGGSGGGFVSPRVSGSSGANTNIFGPERFKLSL